MRQQVEHALPSLRTNTEDLRGFVRRGLVDGEPTEFQVYDLHESIRPFDDVGQNLPFSQDLGDSAFQCLVQLLELCFICLANSDVDRGSGHSHTAAAAIEHASSLP